MGLSDADIGYLERAMLLADKGRGCTSPNPVVGAVIVRNGEIAGEGYHVGAGEDHAEIAALRNALQCAGTPVPRGERVRDSARCPGMGAGATMYVTLEPCCTYGRTPPCTEALILAGFSRVVIGVVDPSPDVNGKGIDILQGAGLQVDVADGEIARRIKRQNDAQRKAVTQGLPFVTYKYAMTLDGRVATDSGDSKWISGAESRRLVHQWRAWSDAVVVGAGTVAADDPLLTARDVSCDRQPLRVVVDRELGLDRNSALVGSVSEGPVLAICSGGVESARRTEVESWGVQTCAAPLGDDGSLDPVAVVQCLFARGIQSVLLEGGPRLAGAWWAAGLIDKLAAFVCPLVASGRHNRGPLSGAGVSRMEEASVLREVEVQQMGRDVLMTGYTREPY